MGTFRAISGGEDYTAALRDIRAAVYHGLPGWHEPPEALEYQRFNPDRESFWRSHIGQTFVHEEKGRVNARVTVFMPNTAGTAGRFGAFDCIDDADISGRLLELAAQWLLARGASRMEGPYSFSVHEEAGVLMRGFETPAAVFMPYNPGYYAGLLRQAGFDPIRKFITYRFDIVKGGRAPDAKPRQGDGLVVRPFDVARIRLEAARLLDIYNSAFSTDPGFAPLSVEDAFSLIRSLLDIGDPELTRIAEFEGNHVGFVVAVPDVNAYLYSVRGYPEMLKKVALGWALRRGSIEQCRVVLLAVKRDFQGKAAARGMVDSLVEAARRKGYRRAELAVDTEDRRLRRLLGDFELVADKEYQLFGKELAPMGLWPRVSGWSSRGVRGGR